MSPQGAYAASKFAVEALSECLAQEAKPFNIRVAIVEPGIVDTPMAQRISGRQGASHYPQQNRMAAFYISVLKSPALPSLVADRSSEIAISGTWQLPTSSGTGRRAISHLAQGDDRRGVGGLGIARRRCLVRPSQGRVRDRCPSAGLTIPA